MENQKKKDHHEEMIWDFKIRFWIFATLILPILSLYPMI